MQRNAKSKKPNRPAPVIIPAKNHSIAMQSINEGALKVLRRLRDAGFDAYLVGGGVRDLLLNYEPKDFDVVTNAHPEDVRRIFRNSRLIGRRFRLVHVYFTNNIIEVATFRASGEIETPKEHYQTKTGMIIRDNVYGTIEEDAWRRDLTINALYYNIANSAVVDYVGGMADVKNRIIRVIGDPAERYHEDPVRMLRAVRLAAKLDFTIQEESAKPIFELAGLLLNVSPMRLYEEINKLYVSGRAQKSFQLLRHYGLFSILFPQSEASLTDHEGLVFQSLLTSAFTNADERIAEGKLVNMAFLFAVLLWGPLQHLIREYQAQGEKFFPSLYLAMEKVMRHQRKSLNIPRRLTMATREIWLMQYRFPYRSMRRVYRIFYHPRFRAAYDFLMLRKEAGEEVEELSEWWTKFQTVDEAAQHRMIHEAQTTSKKNEKL